MVLRVKVGNEVGSLMGCQECYRWEAVHASKGRCDPDCKRRHGNLKILWFVVA